MTIHLLVGILLEVTEEGNVVSRVANELPCLRTSHNLSAAMAFGEDEFPPRRILREIKAFHGRRGGAVRLGKQGRR